MPRAEAAWLAILSESFAAYTGSLEICQELTRDESCRAAAAIGIAGATRQPLLMIVAPFKAMAQAWHDRRRRFSRRGLFCRAPAESTDQRALRTSSTASRSLACASACGALPASLFLASWAALRAQPLSPICPAHFAEPAPLPLSQSIPRAKPPALHEPAIHPSIAEPRCPRCQYSLWPIRPLP